MFRLTAALSLSLLLLLPAGPAGAAGDHDLRVSRLATEYADNPLGIDVATPRLSWTLASGTRGQAQTAYQILVASSADRLAAGRADVWDSGRVRSGQSVNVDYGGPALASRTRYHWKVRVWDRDGAPSDWSPSAWWETALRGGDWRGRWIGGPASALTLDGDTWIWYPEGDPAQTAPSGTRYFRRDLVLPDGARVASATALFTADNQFTAYLNGTEVARSDGTVNAWQHAVRADVTAALHAGRNTLAVAATNEGAGPAGLIGSVQVTLADGSTGTTRTDGQWKAATTAPAGWTDPGFDDSGWPAALATAAYGQPPWNGSVTLPRPADPLLRTTFQVRGPVQSARVYLAGLGYHELRLNGTKVGDAVLEGDVNDYTKRVGYSTYDVTSALRQHTNALGVMLGRGFYDTQLRTPLDWGIAPWTAEPEMLLQLEIRYRDGTSQTVASDGTWQATEGPIVADSVYGGEVYDAGRERAGWDTPTGDTSGWPAARLATPPAGRLVATDEEPVRVTDTLHTVATSQPSPGVYVLDLGHTITGWGRLRVAGAAGTAVTLTYGEKLRADGTVDNSNDWSSGGSQTDRYVLKGVGTETWEPRFSFKAFRYVQVTGLPAAPTADTVTGRWVHSAVDDAGDFDSANPLYATLHDGMRRTILDNLEGYPAVDPLYEKSGWTEDVFVAAQSMADNFDMARFFTEWLDDIRDSELPSGQLPIIIPSPGWGYTSWGTPSPVWTAVYPIMAWRMYQNYGDRRVLTDHYQGIRQHIDYELGRLGPDGLADNALGDYLAPGYPAGNPPEDLRLAGTAYVYRELTILVDIARVLGRDSDATRYTRAAATVRDSFNAAYLDRARGWYVTASDPGYRQTSNLLPLAFGMVPAADRQRVLDSVVADIHAKGDHLDTGTLGTEVLLPYLTENGLGGLASTIANQRTYPSWGYWYDNGADTMWEYWGLTARSRAHFFLGMVDEWFYRDLAGITVDPAHPGYQHVVVRPYLDGAPDRVRASHRSLYGTVTSDWAKTGPAFRLTVTVPVNTTATVCVPAPGPVSRPPGARDTGRHDGCAWYEVGSGSYTFRTGP